MKKICSAFCLLLLLVSCKGNEAKSFDLSMAQSAERVRMASRQVVLFANAQAPTETEKSAVAMSVVVTAELKAMTQNCNGKPRGEYVGYCQAQADFLNFYSEVASNHYRKLAELLKEDKLEDIKALNVGVSQAERLMSMKLDQQRLLFILSHGLYKAE